jgi:hypothetical protein
LNLVVDVFGTTHNPAKNRHTMDFFHTSFLKILPAPSFWTGALALWLFSAAVSAMDEPHDSDSRFYGWLYRFTHLLAANLDRALRPVSAVQPLPEQDTTVLQTTENK